MDEQTPQRPDLLLAADDFARKLEAIRRRHGSLAKFLKAQQSRSPRESNECALGKRRFPVTT